MKFELFLTEYFWFREFSWTEWQIYASCHVINAFEIALAYGLHFNITFLVTSARLRNLRFLKC